MPRINDERERYTHFTEHGAISPWEGALPQYPPDSRLRITDMHIQVDLRQLKAQKAQIVLTLTVESRGSVIPEIPLNITNIKITRVMSQQKPVNYVATATSLVLSLPVPLGQKQVLTIEYEIDHPLTGLHFIYPTAEQPERPYQVWTHGETEEARYWLPCIDAPSQMFTSRMTIRVPAGFMAISNGRLAEKREETDGSITWDWCQEKPHASYLVTLTVGQFSEYAEKGYSAVDLRYYADKRYSSDDLYRSFKNTPKFMQFFIDKLGPYPWAKYYQVVCDDFTGAMENTSSTSWSGTAIRSADSLAAFPHGIEATTIHEMAHQWFGDLVIIRHWPHTWVKEAMAVYLESCYWEYALGHDDFLFDMYINAKDYLEEAKQYQRAIVEYRYNHSWQLYDSHTYPGGAWRYHMIRHTIGDEQWWKLLQYFLKKHQHQNVDTYDMIKAIQEVTGRNMEQFFDQWIFRPGYPKLKIDTDYDKQNKNCIVTIEQLQAKIEDKNKTEIDLEKLFVFPLEIGWLDGKNEWHYHTFEITKYKQSFAFPANDEPQVIHVDPNFKLIKEIDFEMPATKAEKLLQYSKNIIGRIEAVHQLCKKITPKSASTIVAFIKKESHPETHLELLQILADTKAPYVEALLLQYLTEITDTQRLYHLIGTLGKFESEKVAQALVPFLKHDNTYIVAVAGSSIAKTQVIAVLPELQKALERKSMHLIIHSEIMNGLGDLRDPAVLPVLTKIAMSPAYPVLWVRLNAVAALAKVGQFASKKERADLIGNLEKLLFDDYHSKLRMAAASTLSKLHAAESRAAIEAFKKRESSANAIFVQNYLTALSLQEDMPKELKQLRDDLEKLRKEQLDQNDRLIKLEAKFEKP